MWNPSCVSCVSYSSRSFAHAPMLGQRPKTHDFTHNADPFIGVDNGGNTFVAAVIPYGMVKLEPDIATFDNCCSAFGYFTAGNILGLSLALGGHLDSAVIVSSKICAVK